MAAPAPSEAAAARAPPRERVLFWGNLCLDNICEVASYPAEDSGQRALGYRKCVGGNGGNSTRVLAQLRAHRSVVSWLGPVPGAEDPDTAFTLAALRRSGVDTALREEAGGEGLPTSFILSSRETGSRTIVSTRNGVPELSATHFAAAVRRAFSEAREAGEPRWCHLECRQAPGVVAEMARAWREEAPSHRPLSLEVEKTSLDLEKLIPLIAVCDHVFFSQGFVEANPLPPSPDDGADEPAAKRARLGGEASERETHAALRFLRALRSRAAPAFSSGACWVCPWGETGAFALDTASGEGFFEPAHRQPRVVDTVGAGDTFIATYIHARLQALDTPGALQCGCAVAGRKVSQVGFDGLTAALPEGAAKA